MQETYWVLIDTETTGIKAPIHVVDLGAQLMRGWEPEGTSFQRLINTAGYISPEASRIHGYTKEILERDGFPPQDVYGEFSKEFLLGLQLLIYQKRIAMEAFFCSLI